MKNLIHIVFLVFVSLTSYGQNSDIFQTWYLTNYSLDLGGAFDVSDVEPPISPSWTFTENLEYTGEGACNTFSGTFSYDTINDILFTETFVKTSNICEFESHTDFENDYFTYFDVSGFPVDYAIQNEGSGVQSLYLDIGNSALFFSNELLSNSSSKINTTTLYPNPTSDILLVTSETSVVEKITIYDLSGQLILQQLGNGSSVNVSELSGGLYFAEISSEEGKTIEKFVKI